LEIPRYWVRAASSARLEAFGTPVGQLLAFGKIDEAEYSAARAWAKLAARYRLAIESLQRPRSVGLERIGSRSAGAAAAPGDAVDKAVIDRFLAARSVLLAHGWRVERTVSQCCEELGRAPVGYQELSRLRDGLSALAALWRLKGRQSGGRLRRITLVERVFLSTISPNNAPQASSARRFSGR
jgi:hypothetical protein